MGAARDPSRTMLQCCQETPLGCGSFDGDWLLRIVLTLRTSDPVAIRAALLRFAAGRLTDFVWHLDLGVENMTWAGLAWAHCADRTTNLLAIKMTDDVITHDMPSPSAPPGMSFAGHLDDAGLQIANAGFSTDLWEPEFGWEAAEQEAAEAPFPPQLLAALQCFVAFFARLSQRFWVHLAAEMQAGKTGVVTALIRLILKNAVKLHLRPTRIFVLTGMNDNAWEKQTRDRLPMGIRRNVYHSGGLAKFAKVITSLAAGEELKNVLVILDESHLASAASNRPSKQVYDRLAELCPREKWVENNIRILTISATDPAKVLVVRDAEEACVVRLQTTSAYQSVQSLAAAGRIRWLEEFKDMHEDTAIAELVRCVAEEFSDAPHYHLIRARYGKQKAVVDKLSAAFPGCRVIKFDSEEKLMRPGGADESISGLSEIEDINELLAEAPEQHTFIVLKNMFYAAKTLHDEHVGVLWDRLSGKDDTNLQSLLGRACGYGKSDRTVIYASKQTVENYDRYWRELSSNPRFPPILTGVPVSVAKKMTGVSARYAGGGVELFAAPGTAGPSGAARAAAPARQKANEDDFTHEFKEFKTFEEAKAWGKNIRCPMPDENGFLKCKAMGTDEKLPYASILALCTGKKTAQMPLPKEVGKSSHRLYVGYKDMTDITSVVFIVRALKRIH